MNAESTFIFAQEQDSNRPVKHDHTSLRDCVERALTDYFADLDGQHCTDLYQVVMQEVEAPLLVGVMKYTRDNQSKAAAMLGLNRGTLRKKLKEYDLL
ncbi:MAG: DNA-binding transcriptional regulator Fis [Gammaproteobacteria bacterium]|nr:MAG: DNA-binding transcriptional regulator Fis [Gammaproteobacteria bacterium]